MTITEQNEHEDDPGAVTAEQGTVRPATKLADAGAAQRRRQLGGVSANDRLNVVGAAACGVCVALLLFGRLAPFSGVLGFVVVAYVVFLAAYAMLVSFVDDGPAVRDKVMTVLCYTSGLIAFTALVYGVAYTLYRGRTALVHVNFFTQDMQQAGPLDPLTVGGIKHALVGTLWMIGIALAITVPLGLACAVYLNEARGRFPRFVRIIVDAMTALPSIVAGLFIYATWILTLHKEKSALAASGHQRDDAPDHHPGLRRGTPTGTGPTSRGVGRSRGAAMAHSLARGTAHCPLRPGHLVQHRPPATQVQQHEQRTCSNKRKGRTT